MPHHKHNHHHHHHNQHHQQQEPTQHHRHQPSQQNGRHHHGNSKTQGSTSLANTNGKFGKTTTLSSHANGARTKTDQSESGFDAQLPVPKLSLLSASILVAAVSLVCYWNSCHGDFVFDDIEAVVGNKDVLLDTPMSSVFWNDFWGMLITKKESHKSYRPLTVLTFRLNYYLSSGLHPWGFHATNILLHVFICILSLHVLSLLFTHHHGRRISSAFDGAPRASLLGAVLFATHPIHTESVAGIVGRADLLCALCFFTSFLLYSSAIRKDSTGVFSWLRLFLSMLFCAISMFCKEQGITVIGVCSAYDIISINRIHPLSMLKSMLSKRPHLPEQSVTDVNENIQKDTIDRRWLKYLIQRQIVLCASAVFLLVLRLGIVGKGLPSFQPIDNPASFADSLLTRVVNYNYIYALNAWLLLNPWWLCFDWSMGCVPLIDSITDPRILAPVVFLTFLVFLLYKCICHPPGHDVRLLTMSLAMIIIPFLPASNLFLRVGFVIAERVLYLPSLGFCMLLVIGFARLCQNARYQKIVHVLLYLLITVYIWRCIHRNQDWNNEKALYTAGLKVCPLNAKVHYNVGKNAGDYGRIGEAISEYEEAIRLHPQYDQAMNNLANILKDRGQELRAEKLLRKAVEIRPSFAAAWMNLGIVLMSLKKYEESEMSYKTALKHKHAYPDCYFNLGNLYLDINRHSDALAAWLNATSLKNNHARAWTNSAVLLESLGDYKTAIAVASEGLRYVPEEPSLHFCLGNVLGKVEKFEEAELHFKEAVRLEPNNPSYYGNMGVLYHRWGRHESAMQYYQKSLKLDPKGTNVRENLKKLQSTLEKKNDANK